MKAPPEFGPENRQRRPLIQALSAQLATLMTEAIQSKLTWQEVVFTAGVACRYIAECAALTAPAGISHQRVIELAEAALRAGYAQQIELRETDQDGVQVTIEEVPLH